MSKEKLLLVEDDKHISKLVKYNLEKAGYDCRIVESGEAAFKVLESSQIDLVILDIMLPKMDGFEVCREIRQDSTYGRVPIIMLTAKGEEIDKIVGLEMGADDYMVKPFSPRELTLRVKAVLRRGGEKKEEAGEILEVKKLKVDLPRHKVTINSKEIKLTSMEFDLIVTLMKRSGRVQTRDQLLSDVWNLDSEITTRTIDTHVKRLRQKLGKMGKYIETVRGMGYRFFEEE